MVETVSKEPFGERLRQARVMHEFSLRELSARMEGLVSHNALNKYEKGEMLPGSAVLSKLCEILEVPSDYFFRTNLVDLKRVEFRKQQKLTKTEENAIREKARDYFERYLEIEDILGIAETFVNPLEGMIIRGENDIDKAADALREKWALGCEPIKNVQEMLEDKGLKIFELSTSESFNGFSGWADAVPVIVIGEWLNQSATIPRKRLTLLHELAHLVLTFDDSLTHRQRETLCNRFAGTVLLPCGEAKGWLGERRSKFSWGELGSVTQRFGISMGATVMRAKQCGIITEYDASMFWKEYSAQGYRKGEPAGLYEGQEESRRFENLVFRAVSEEIITRSKAAALLEISASELRRKMSRPK